MQRLHHACLCFILPLLCFPAFSQSVIYVNANVQAGNGDGSSWENAFSGEQTESVDGVDFSMGSFVVLYTGGAGDTCYLSDNTSPDPFPIAPPNCTVDPDSFIISGNIRKEDGTGVGVQNDPPDAGIFIVSKRAGYGDNCTTLDSLVEDTYWDCWEVTASVEDTTNCGDYSHTFECGAAEDFIIMPKKDNDDHVNGVTTFDLVLMTKHILHTDTFESPYQIIAGDANNNKFFTTFDIALFKKLILQIDTILVNTSWRFVDAVYTFPNPSDPWEEDFPECIHVDMSNTNTVTAKDFIAIKIGDVNLGADPDCSSNLTGNGAEDRSRSVKLTANNNTNYKTGETMMVDFWMYSPQELVSWEMGLRFDPRNLQLEEAIPGNLDGMNLSCFGLAEAAQGKLRALWLEPSAQPINFENGYHAFSLRFKVLLPIEDFASVLSLDDSVLKGRAYEDDGTENAIKLEFEKVETVAAQHTVPDADMKATAIPNPFTNELRFFISVPEDDWLELSVFDVNGRLVATWSGETLAKEREVVFGNTDAWGEGVFTYRARTARHILTGKVTRQ